VAARLGPAMDRRGTVRRRSKCANLPLWTKAEQGW